MYMDTGPTFPPPLLGLDYPQALSVVLMTQLIGAFYVHSLSTVLSPGLPRVLAALPVLATNLATPRLFQRKHQTTILLTAFNTAWLSSFKILLWSVNRSSLASRSRNAAQFVAILLTPLTPLADAPSHRKRQLRPLSPANLIFRGAANLVLLGVVLYLLLDPWRFPPMIRAFLYGLGLYGLLSSVMDGPGVVVSRALGIVVSPHFDAPWLAAGVASFWNSRWDISAGNALRQLIYDPIMEGRVIGGEFRDDADGYMFGGAVGDESRQRSGKDTVGVGVAPSAVPSAVPSTNTTPSPHHAHRSVWSRQLIGSGASFLVSGLVHEGIFWYLTGFTSRGAWLGYFLVQAPAIAIERAVLSALRRRGIEAPRALLTAYLIFFQCAVSAVLFWGPAERYGLVEHLVHGVQATLTDAMHLMR